MSGQRDKDPMVKTAEPLMLGAAGKVIDQWSSIVIDNSRHILLKQLPIFTGQYKRRGAVHLVRGTIHLGPSHGDHLCTDCFDSGGQTVSIVPLGRTI